MCAGCCSCGRSYYLPLLLLHRRSRRLLLLSAVLVLELLLLLLLLDVAMRLLLLSWRLMLALPSTLCSLVQVVVLSLVLRLLLSVL